MTEMAVPPWVLTQCTRAGSELFRPLLPFPATIVVVRIVMLRALELSARPLSMAGAGGIPFIGIAGIIVQDIVDICKELKLHKVRLMM